MKKVLCNYRYYVLFILAVVSILGIFIEPADNLSALSWLWILTCSKVIGLAAGWLIYRLILRWENKNAIPELSTFINEF